MLTGKRKPYLYNNKGAQRNEMHIVGIRIIKKNSGGFMSKDSNSASRQSNNTVREKRFERVIEKTVPD